MGQLGPPQGIDPPQKPERWTESRSRRAVEAAVVPFLPLIWLALVFTLCLGVIAVAVWVSETWLDSLR